MYYTIEEVQRAVAAIESLRREYLNFLDELPTSEMRRLATWKELHLIHKDFKCPLCLAAEEMIIDRSGRTGEYFSVKCVFCPWTMLTGYQCSDKIILTLSEQTIISRLTTINRWETRLRSILRKFKDTKNLAICLPDIPPFVNWNQEEENDL